jgi:hypothetical protein
MQDFRDKFIKHLVTRPWSPVQVMQRSILNSKKSGTWSEKMTNSEDLTRKVPYLARQGAMSNSERNWRQGPTCRRGKHLEDTGTDIKQRRPRAGPGWAQAGRPSLVQGPVGLPFALAAIRAIYSPGVKSHASSNSSSAAEEQRREGHHPGEERVELARVSLADVGTLHRRPRRSSRS